MSVQLALICSLIFLMTVCDTITQLCLKRSINSTALEVNTLWKAFRLIFRIVFLPLTWVAALFSAISLSLWLFVLSKADLSFAFSLDSLHYVLIALAARIFLKEQVEARRWIGTILIMAGIVLVTLTAK